MGLRSPQTVSATTCKCVCVVLMSGCNVKSSGVSALLPRSLSPAMLPIMPGIAGHTQMSVERGRVFQTPCILAVS